LLAKQQIIRCGYLIKRALKRKSWKKRWFILKTTQLCYYDDEREYKLIRAIPLADIQAIAHVPRKRRPYVIGLVTVERKYYFQAPDQMEMEAWMKDLKQARGELKTHQERQAAGIPVAAMTPPPPLLIRRRRSSAKSAGPLSPTTGDTSEEEEEDEEDEEGLVTLTLQGKDTSDALTLPAHPGLERELRGYLLKKTELRKTWKKRWLVLRDGRIVYYKKEEDPIPHQVIQLSTIQSVQVMPDPKPGKKRRYRFKLVLPDRSLRFAADDKTERDRWCYTIMEERQRLLWQQELARASLMPAQVR